MSNYFNQKGLDSKSDGNFSTEQEPIPDKTQALAYVESAEWKQGFAERNEANYISLTWRILQPDEHADRVVFQKLHVDHDDLKKQKRAVAMLQAIDANAGGGIAKFGGFPDAEVLQKNLVQKPMMLLLRVWKIEETGATGNWVAAVTPKPNGAPVAPQAPSAPKATKAAPAASKVAPGPSAPYNEDDIPF